MSRPLENYLRTHRKRSELTQDEVAFLLGMRCGTAVSHYERFNRQPSLETALALEVIFSEPTSRLFAGPHGRIRRQVASRARQLARRLSKHPDDPIVAAKLGILEVIDREHRKLTRSDP